MKNGFLLGKFYPFTLGHVYLIESSLNYCDNLTVLVCSLPSEDIDGVYRYEAVKEYFKNNNRIKVFYYDKFIPQEPKDDVNFWNKWIPLILKVCPDIDIVFASEDYAKDIAEHIGKKIEYKIIDKYREQVNISGTEVRANPMKNYNLIAPTMRWFFNKKVAIVGAESVGKSTLTKRLADYFHTSYAVEYGREHCEKHHPLTDDDFVVITNVQDKLIKDVNKEAYKIMFSDTEALTTKVFLPKYVLNSVALVDNYIEQYVINQKFDLYILIEADNASTQDGTRKFLSDRETHQKEIIAVLEKYKKTYVILNGTYEEKFLKAINLCNKLIN